MAPVYYGGLPTATLRGHSPPTYTFVTGNQILLPIIWLKSMVHSPDPFKDALKRPITTIPPSITTTHHDGGLPSPLSYTLPNNNPPLPSMCTQHLRQNVREPRREQTDLQSNMSHVSFILSWFIMDGLRTRTQVCMCHTISNGKYKLLNKPYKHEWDPTKMYQITTKYISQGPHPLTMLWVKQFICLSALP